MTVLVILAGGKSSRMGKDKVFLDYKGGTFLSNLIAAGDKVFDRVIISGGSKEHTAKIKQYIVDYGFDLSHEIIRDNYDAAGPIGGILSILEETDVDSFALTAVDAPFASMKVLSLLLETLNSSECAGKSAVMLKNTDGKYEACIAAYSRSAYPIMKKAVDEGRRSLVFSLGTENIYDISLQTIKEKRPDIEIDNNILKNVNTAEEFRSICEK